MTNSIPTPAVTDLSSPASGIAAVRQLVFIDRDVPDLVRLMSGLAAGTRAYLLDASRDALAQIADALDRHSPVEAVHIVAHGSPGELHFSSGTVSRAGLAHDATALARIDAALAPHADLLLWACEVGRGQEGEKFLDALAAATGAHVAAATHPVGSAPLGGSWDLDATVGAVAAGIPFAAAQNFAGLLSAPVLSNVTGPVTYTENAAGAVLASGLTISDADDTTLRTALVQISSGFLAGDVLAADVSGTGITARYDAVTGTLTLSGDDTLLHYQQVLRTVRFSSTSDNPTVDGSNSSRSFDWSINDHGEPTPSFQTHADYAVGASPNSVVLGDFNGDGILDLAVANTGSNTVSVLLGNGAGGFGAATNFAVGTSPSAVTAGDFNNDGKLDLAVGNLATFSELLGDGTGGFGAAISFAAGSGGLPTIIPSIKAMDVNHDGNLDILYADAAGGNVYWSYGDGTGNFPSNQARLMFRPVSVALGDLNGDGYLDYVGADSGGAVWVRYGLQQSFGDVDQYPVGGGISSVAIGDLNGDGIPDIAVAYSGTGTVAVLFGTGTAGNTPLSVAFGTGNTAFGTPVTFAAGPGALTSIAIGDINGDGKLDLAATTSAGDVSVLLGNGAGNFGAPTTFATGASPNSIVIEDLNADGALDIVVANANSASASVLLNSATSSSTIQHSAVAITAVNDAPVVGSGGIFAYTEQAGGVRAGQFTTLSDADSQNLVGATVTISAGRQAGDTLHLISQNGISGSYNAGNGVLTLSGSSSLANYAAALRSVTFDNLTNQNPTDFGTDKTRTFTWQVNDGSGSNNLSTPVTSQINITATNDAPALAGVTTTVSYTESGAGTLLSGAIAVSDPDNTVLVSASVNIGAGFTTGDTLTANANGTNITAHYDATIGRLTFTGTDTLAHYQQVLRTVTYSSTSNNPTDSGLHPSRTIDWQVNDGGPTAFQGTSYAVGSTPDSVAVADLNGDGKLDLVIANAGSNTVSVLLGNGAGGFGPAISFNVGTGAASVTVGDLDGDGKLDLVVANTGSNTVSVLLGNGAGGFGAASNFATGAAPNSVAIGDLNGDGKPDLVVGTSEPDAVFGKDISVLLGTGNGSFGAATNTRAGSSPRAATIADLNDDGKLDVIVGSTLAGSIVILSGDGAGGFNSTRQIGVGLEKAVALAVGDLNGDGSADIVVAGDPSGNGGGVVHVLLGDGAGGFGPVTFYSLSVSSPNSVAIGDLNGDGKVDLAVGDAGGNVVLLNGNGDGTFQSATKFVTGSGTNSVVTGDFNGDGKLDLAVAAGTASGTAAVYLNSGPNLSPVQHTTVAITADNSTPVATAGGSASYSEQAAAIVVDNTVTLSDLDDARLIGATVTITNAQSGDTLHFSSQNGITGSFANNVLTLSGPATIAQYEAALRSVTFDNTTNNNSTNYGANPSRTVSWVVNDGGANNNLSTAVTSTIAITAVNDAPQVVASGGTTAANEQIARIVDSAITVSDADNTKLASATVSVSGNFYAGEDVLGFANDGSTMGNIAGSYDGTSGQLALTSSGASATLAQWQSALRAVTYTDTSDTPSTANRSISFVVNDGTDASLVATKTVSVAAVNDAPAVNGAVTLAAIAEDSGVRLITQAQLLGNAGDVDGPPLTAINLAIAAGGGTLVENNNGTWSYTPVANDDTSVSFSYELTDGVAASVAASATLDITPVNDAPVVTGAVTLAAIAEESGARLITQAQLLGNVSDVDGPSLTAANLAIAVGSGTLIDNNDGTWSYTPVLNDDTSVSFSYQVTDGTAFVAGSATLDIMPVNDAPVVTGAVTLAATAEDSGARLITQAQLLGNVTDVDGPPLTVANLAIAAGAGTLVNNNNGTWSYTPAANDDTSVSFSYEVTDGVAASIAGSATLDITAVNDAPVAGNVTLPAIQVNSGAHIIAQAQLLADTADVDSSLLTVTDLHIDKGFGSLVNNGNGSWTYTPKVNDDTQVDFVFTASDGLLSANGQAKVDISSAQSAPEIGTPGNDAFTAVTGNSIYNGQGGIDTINFGFKLTDATVSYVGNTVVVDAALSHTVLTGVERFAFTDGTVDNNDGNWLVDDLFYYSHHHDVWSAHADADFHYNAVGWKEGRDPNAFFDTSIYLSANPDVAANGENPLIHFEATGWKEGRIPSPTFDGRAYLAANPDVAAAHIDPLWHFLAVGAGEGRQPIAPDRLIGANGFDYVYYLNTYTDVKAAGVDPLQHFQTGGWIEGRNPNSLFDTAGYLAAYTDVAAAHINPFDHFNAAGWHEGRDPSVDFDTASYLAAYPDVAAAKINPLTHFLSIGQDEGRSAFADGIWG
jgi:hypothetical protein